MISNIKRNLLKTNKKTNDLYRYSQILFAYNSNKIEGNSLTFKLTEELFNKLDTNNNYIDDDQIEMVNHFRLFDYMLDSYNQELSQDLIIKYHTILKAGTSQSFDYKYNVGGYKISPNIIGVVNVINTSSPENVSKDIKQLLNNYNSLKNITINDIIDFHYQFEKIHPFSDGNGRVGRIIMFKECLKNNIVPFVVLDQYKAEYINGLNKYKNPIDKNYLIDTCLFFQDNYKYVVDQLSAS